jgi:hypothetical protein
VILVLAMLLGCGHQPGLTSPAQAGEEQDITGTYNASGGDFTITRNGEVYQVRWEYPDGRVWVGVALLEGKTLSVAWDFPTGGNLGVAVYKVEKGEKGPNLVGRWAAYQDPRSTADTIAFVKK